MTQTLWGEASLVLFRARREVNEAVLKQEAGYDETKIGLEVWCVCIEPERSMVRGDWLFSCLVYPKRRQRQSVGKNRAAFDRQRKCSAASRRAFGLTKM